MPSGVRIIRSNWGRTHQALRLDVRMRVKNVAEAIRDNARILAPVGTEWEHSPPFYPGYLRDNIVVQMVNQFAWIVVANAFYSPYVELGTYKMEAQPFLLPAYQKVRVLLPSIKGQPSVWVGW